MACHAQNQTKLNSFGRKFALSAYTMSYEEGPQTLIEGEGPGLSLPSVLSLSVMLKARFDKSDKVKNRETIDTSRGVHEVFKDATLHLSGRVADHVGSIIEFRTKDGKAVVSGKVALSFESDTAYRGISLFSTNSYGPFSGMENYNTGLYKPLLQFENRKLTNAAQASGLGSGAATGLQAYYAGEHLFMTIGAYVPAHNSTGIDVGSGMLPFIRLAYEQPVADIVFIGGVYGIKGHSTASSGDINSTLGQTATNIRKEAYGLDLQLEGKVLEIDTLLTINLVFKDSVILNDPDNTASGKIIESDIQANSIELAIYPKPAFGVKIAYLTLNDRGLYTNRPAKIDLLDKTAYTLGVDYSFRQNITLTTEYSLVQPNKQNIENYSDLLAVLTLSF